MLVAETVLPDDPSHGKIKGGDIVLKVNGISVAVFQQLENLRVETGQDIHVKDLEKISPSRFVSVAGASFHALSYQMAAQYAIACKGVYMCECGTISEFRWRNGCLIESINHRDTPNLSQFVEVMRDLHDRARVIIRHRVISDLHTTHTTVLSLNRHWPSTMKMLTRNDATGQWDFEVLAQAPPQIPRVPLGVLFPQTALHPIVKDIPRSFVAVSCKMPLYLERTGTRHTSGMGVIIDAARGIVLVSRAVVPHTFCTIEITVADTVLEDAKTVFLHPTYGYALVQYQPSLVLAEVQSVVFEPEEVLQGTPVIFVGYTDNKTMACTPTTVTRIRPIDVAPSIDRNPVPQIWTGSQSIHPSAVDVTAES